MQLKMFISSTDFTMMYSGTDAQGSYLLSSTIQHQVALTSQENPNSNWCRYRIYIPKFHMAPWRRCLVCPVRPTSHSEQNTVWMLVASHKDGQAYFRSGWRRSIALCCRHVDK